jgi:hypothetical protein
MNKFEKKLQSKGQLIEAGAVVGGVKCLKVIPPSIYARVITRCPKCKKTSLFWMGNFKNGRSRCSHGCFRGRSRLSAQPDLPAAKKKEKIRKHTGKESTSDRFFRELEEEI